MSSSEASKGTFGALKGLVVLDLTQMLAGPFGTQMLADHGAEVIKIEPPEGDPTRAFGPFHPNDTVRSHGAYYQSINRNKKSVVIDLKSDAGRIDFLALVARADILVENFRAGVMDRLQLGWERIQKVNPRLIYASVRGFGDENGGGGGSPYASWPAYDVIAQSIGGLIGITGNADGSVVKVGPGVGDTVPGLLLAFGVLAAVYERSQSGKGQYVDVAMADTVLALCERIVYQYSYQSVIAGPEGNHHPTFAPFGIFPARDGFISIACVRQAQWETFCELMGRPDLGNKPEFSTPELRSANRALVIDSVAEMTSGNTKAQLLQLLGDRVPIGPVYNAADIFADPHFTTRGMLQQVHHPGVAEPLEIVGVPLKLSRTPGRIARGAATLGEHTESVLHKRRGPATPKAMAGIAQDYDK